MAKLLLHKPYKKQIFCRKKCENEIQFDFKVTELSISSNCRLFFSISKLKKAIQKNMLNRSLKKD